MFSYNKAAGQGQFQRERFGPDLAGLIDMDSRKTNSSPYISIQSSGKARKLL